MYLEGIDLYKNKAPTARIGFEVKGATGTRTVVKKLGRETNLLSESNGLEEYDDRYIITNIDGRDNSVTFLNGLKLYAGQIQGNEQMTALQRRVQIRETITTYPARAFSRFRPKAPPDGLPGGLREFTRLSRKSPANRQQTAFNGLSVDLSFI